MKEMLDDWYACKTKLASGEISTEEYTDWVLNYPEKSDLLFNRKSSKNNQRNRSILIRGIKNTLERKKCPKKGHFLLEYLK